MKMMETNGSKGVDLGGTLLKLGNFKQRMGACEEAKNAFARAASIFLEAGAEREWAIARGSVADILQARGQLDEALALHEKRLPVAENMRDMDSIAHINFAMARLQLMRGDHESGKMQSIFEKLHQAFGLSLELGRPDFIGDIGTLLAQVLAMVGHPKEALAVLDHAERAFQVLGDADGAAHVAELRARIEKRVDES